MLNISSFSLKLIFIGVEIAILLFVAALICCFVPDKILLVDKFANAAMKISMLAVIIAAANDFSDIILKRKQQ